MASVLAESFDLVGVNGIDFIVHDGVPQAIEVNPRWTGAMELVEQAYGLSVFGAHAAACRAGELPDFDLRSVRQRLSRAVGKAVIFSRHDVAVGDTRSWLNEGGRDAVRDVPRPGQRIPLGGPVCTVFATGPDMAACRAALVTRAERVYARLAGWTLPGG